MRTKILVSACLLGENCKYSGGNNFNPNVVALKEYFDLVPVCPECFGELPIPRVPSEIVGDRVLSKDGEDLTDIFYPERSKLCTLLRNVMLRQLC